MNSKSSCDDLLIHQEQIVPEIKIVKKKYIKKIKDNDVQDKENKDESVKKIIKKKDIIKPKSPEIFEPEELEKSYNNHQKIDRKADLIDSLDKLRKKEFANKETWKARAYSIVIKELKNLEGPVYTYDDVKGVKGIGKSMESKIKELLETGSMSQLADYNANGHLKIMDELLKVYGIGPSKAKELVEKNDVKSVEDLKSHPELLNDKQKIGLKYWEDFEKRIPRKEMEKHDEYLMSIIKEVDPKIVATVTGSYRRKMNDSGDIDVLLTHPDDPDDFEAVLKLLVKRMEDDYIKDVLALGSKKCMAVCRLKSHKSFRRLDLFYTRKHEYPFAVMHFTGSGPFNIKMRNIALSKGYSLSEYGLKYDDKEGNFVEYEFNDEKDIFKFLEVDYVEPENRK